MNVLFDRHVWLTAIRQPDWYVQLYPELKALRKHWETLPETETDTIKQQVRQFFTEAYETGELCVGTSGQNLDKDRLPIDTIVIHHTSGQPGYKPPFMNATQLLNIYVPYFNNPTTPGEESLQGQPIWSNHVRAGRPVFYAYHWLMRMDGTFERLLEDKELGWHAANWDVNRRSIAICLDNDYEKQILRQRS